jgi:hypothetical protein
MGGHQLTIGEIKFSIEGGKIVAIDLLADPARLGELDLVILNR